jgi:uncharacterized membrane protein
MKRPWIGPLAFVVVAFLAFSLPPYLGLDPAQSRLPLNSHTSWHYPVLVGHILFGTVALVTCCMQIWPWLRRKHPALHRRTGRVYVLFGVLPAGLLGIFAGALAVTPGFSGRAGNITLAVVWLAVTFRGFRAARAGRYAEHRRWMIRSFALTTSIIANRFWVVGLIGGLSPFLDSQFGGDQQAMIRAAVEAAIWLSWIVNLFIAEWWIERSRGLASARGRDVKGTEDRRDRGPDRADPAVESVLGV